MTRFALQFGQTQSGLTYLERMSAYGICPRGEANIAIVQIGKKAPYEYDLPGGGIEADEDEAAALLREFQEETGLTVWPTRVIGRRSRTCVRMPKRTPHSCGRPSDERDRDDPGEAPRPRHRAVRPQAR